MNKILLASAAAAAMTVAAPAFATTIDFSGLPIGVYNGAIVTPEATFTSSTGEFYVGAAGLDHEICPLTSAFNCEASVDVAFTSAVDNLTFDTSGYDGTSTLFVSGIASSGAFSTSFSNGGAYTYAVSLSGYSGITSLSLSTDDGAGIAYDHFTFDGSGAVPEPATWAMMITGFGLVGGAMRRRSTKVGFAI